MMKTNNSSNSSNSSVKECIIRVVGAVPCGRVVSYGTVASFVSMLRGSFLSAQMVGWQLSSMPQDQWHTLPWWRVVAATGYISALKLGKKGYLQKQLLHHEGVRILNNYIAMEQYSIGRDELMRALSSCIQ